MIQTNKVSRALFLVLTAILLLGLALPALAQEPTTPVSDDDVNEVAKQLYCPICESTPLDVCATQACADWREVIRTKLSEGQTAEDIKAYFELQYGPQALAEPPRYGFSLAVWVLAVVGVVLIGGAFFIFFYVFSRQAASGKAAAARPGGETRAPDTSAAGQTSAKERYRDQIESELGDI